MCLWLPFRCESGEGTHKALALLGWPHAGKFWTLRVSNNKLKQSGWSIWSQWQKGLLPSPSVHFHLLVLNQGKLQDGKTDQEGKRKSCCTHPSCPSSAGTFLVLSCCSAIGEPEGRRGAQRELLALWGLFICGNVPGRLSPPTVSLPFCLW